MNILKKFAVPLTAVALVALMGVSLLAATRTAFAAASITPSAATTIPLTTNATNGTGVYTPLAGNIVVTGTAANDIVPGTIVFEAPTGWQFDTTVAADVVFGGAGTAAGNATVTYGAGGSTMIVTVTGASTGAATITIGGATKPELRPLTNTSASGNITYDAGQSTGDPVGLGDGTNAGTLTAGAALAAPYTITLSAPVTTIPADGSQATTITATLTDANDVPVANTPINWTVSLGILGTGTSKTATSITNASGTTTQTYRGAGGVEATDTVIAANSSLSVVGTLTMNLSSPTGTTASKIAITAPTQLAVSASQTNVSPGYTSPTTQTNFSVHVTDSAGLGVNGQTVLISVDKGAVALGFNAAACGNTKAVTGTTASGPLTSGSTQTRAGVIALTYCGNQSDAPGQATITAQNISTSMANATTTVTTAGRPAEIEATVTAGQIRATVTDASGNIVADGTPVQFTISQEAGVVSNACTTTSNGVASSAVSLNGNAGNVIVTASYNESGAAATCAAVGAQSVSEVVPITGGTGGTGDGQFASPPVYSASKLAQVVFNGGTIQQLEAAVIAANGTGVWAQDAQGNFELYIIGGGFVNDDFRAAFPNGFSGVTAVTVVGR